MKQAIPPFASAQRYAFSRGLVPAIYALRSIPYRGTRGVHCRWSVRDDEGLFGSKARLSVEALNALFRWLAIPAVKSPFP
jgi:hypothetical protein